MKESGLHSSSESFPNNHIEYSGMERTYTAIDKSRKQLTLEMLHETNKKSARFLLTSGPSGVRKNLACYKRQRNKTVGTSMSETKLNPEPLVIMEHVLKALESRCKSYESGDYSITQMVDSDESIKNSLNNYGQSIKLNSSEYQLIGRPKSCHTKLCRAVSADQKLLDRNMVRARKQYVGVGVDSSQTSLIESGYKTNLSEVNKEESNSHSNEFNKANGKGVDRPMKVSLEEISKVFQEVLENVYDADMQLKTGCNSCKNESETLSASSNRYDMNKLDESLSFVKENLTSIRGDLNDFKEHFWLHIETKVDRFELNEFAYNLESKLKHLEAKILYDASKRNQTDSDFGGFCLKSLNDYIWPVFVVLGAYSIISFCKNKSH